MTVKQKEVLRALTKGKSVIFNGNVMKSEEFLAFLGGQ